MATKIGPTCKSLCAQISRSCHHTTVYRFARGQHQKTGAYKILGSEFWALGGLNQKSKKNSFVEYHMEK